MKVYFGFNDIRQDGMGTEAICLMRALKKKGIEVQPVHAWKHIDVLGYIEEFNPIFICDEYEDPGTKNTIKGMVEYLNGVPYDSIFSHFGSPNWACVIPYLRPDIKIVVSVHSITPSALKIATAYKNRISKFIAISWEVENKLNKYLSKTHHKKISLITNALDPNYYPIRDFSKKTNNKIRIVFFGRIEDVTKGCDKIPKIARKLKDLGVEFDWDFYGYFHWGYNDRFYNLNKEYDVENNIHYKGCLNPAEVAKTIQEYDIFVLTSNHEGFGLALIEAMAVGLACVASRIHNVTDRIIKDGEEGLLCDKNDISEFADAICMLSKDKEYRVKLGINAHNKVRSCFSVEKQALSYKLLFEEALKDNKYKIIKPSNPIDEFVVPETTKPHILARILPLWLKKILKRYYNG